MILKRGEIAMDGDFAYIFEDVTVRRSEENPMRQTVTAQVSATDGTAVEVATPTMEATMSGGTSKPAPSWTAGSACA